MPIPSFTVVCTGKKLLAPSVYEVRFKKPDGFTFKHGQYVLFDVPLPENADDAQARAYSIASMPEDPELLFIVKGPETGRMLNWIERVAEPGALLMMKGPLGIFTVNRETQKNYLFVATGTGVAPFLSQIRWLLEQEKETRAIDLVFGVRQKEDFFWTEAFHELEVRYQNFRCHLSLTSGDADWHAHHGRVQQIIPQVIKDFSNVHVMICGSPEMTKDVKNLCLTEWNVPKENVKVESYV